MIFIYLTSEIQPEFHISNIEFIGLIIIRTCWNKCLTPKGRDSKSTCIAVKIRNASVRLSCKIHHYIVRIPNVINLISDHDLFRPKPYVSENQFLRQYENQHHCMTIVYFYLFVNQ